MSAHTQGHSSRIYLSQNTLDFRWLYEGGFVLINSTGVHNIHNTRLF